MCVGSWVKWFSMKRCVRINGCDKRCISSFCWRHAALSPFFFFFLALFRRRLPLLRLKLRPSPLPLLTRMTRCVLMATIAAEPRAVATRSVLCGVLQAILVLTRAVVEPFGATPVSDKIATSPLFALV